MSRLLNSLLILTFAFTFSACAKNQDTNTASNSNNAIGSKTYTHDDIAFSLPRDWKVSNDIKNPWGTRTIAIDTTGLSTITIELSDAKNESASTAKEIESSISEFATSYKKMADAFSKLGTYKTPPSTTTVTRTGLNGLRETSYIVVLNEETSCVKEFYRINMNDKKAFIVFDAIKKESEQFGSGFDLILKSLTDLKS